MAEKSTVDWKEMIQLLILPVTIIGVCIIVFVLYGLDDSLKFPITVVLGIVIIVGALLIAAAVLRFLQLGCKIEAMGLPAGSIRSLIALSLIIIFIMLAIFLYPSLQPHVNELSSNQTVVYSNGTTISTFNSTSVLTDPTEAQKTFSSQALTTISTLVVAIASFYFGSKAVENARKATSQKSPSKIVTNPSGSAEVVKGSSLTVKLDTVVDEWKIYGDSKGELVMEKPNSFKYTPSEESQEQVMLSFGVSDDPNIKGLLDVKVNEKAQTEEEKKKKPSE
jgi:hypothetical protein